MDERVMDKEEAKQNMRIMADRLARFYYWMTQNLIEEIGEERAEVLLKKVIQDYGAETGEMARKAVEEKGLEPTLDNYSRGGDLPSIGWEAEVLDSRPDSLASKITFCPFAHSWMTRYKGFEKWAKIYCAIDNAKYESYDPKCRCISEKNVLDGDDYCLVKTSR